MMKRIGAVAMFLLCFLVVAAPAHATRRALVIGNKDYVVGALKNPLNDAEAMASVLGGAGGLGFQVTLIKNLKRDDISRTLENFASSIQPNDDVVVFYAGHGLQVRGVNYLPAVDARINFESDVALNSLNLNELLQRLDDAKAGVRVLMVDACRDNPYNKVYRSSTRGLARVEAAPSGTLMHFATRPGGVAEDGTGRNGLYTSELLKHLRTPGLSVESMLKRVASGVRQASGGSQQPWTEGALDGDFYFAPGSANASALPEPVRPPPQQQVAPQPVAPAIATRPPAMDEPDAKGLEAVVNQKFREWSAGWFMDRFIPGSARVEKKDCSAQGCKVAGTFSFVRGGAKHSIPFAAAMGGSGSDLSVQRLCYQDNTSGMQDCTD
jgi:Caspase domain